MRLMFLMMAMWMGSVLPVAAQKTSALADVVADALPGAELGAKLMKADAQMGGACGTIVVGRAASLSTGATLSACHSLRVDAIVQFDGAATITLKGGQTVACGSGGGFASSGKGAFFTLAANAANLDIGAGCTAANATEFVRATSGGVKHVRVHDATLKNVEHGFYVEGSKAAGVAADPTQTSDVNFDHNHVTGGKVGLLVNFAHGATCTWNDTNGNENPCQFWGGDADPAHGGTFATGLMTDVDFSHNHCVHVNSCAWGSMGRA